MNENLSFTGKLHIKIMDINGVLKYERIVKNLVVNAGNSFICSRMVDASASVMSHMGVGSGTDAALVGDTALQTEITRVALTSAINTGNTVTYVGDFPAGVGTGTITEAGILNNSVGGTLLARTVFSAIPKGAADIMSISWTITAG